MILCISVNLSTEQLEWTLPRTLWEEMLDALDAATPFIEDTRPGLAFLDMGSAAEAANSHLWLTRVHELLHPFKLPVITGLAENAFCAHVAAIIAHQRRSHAYAHCANGNEARFLASVPITVLAATLQVDIETIERLHLLGITTLGHLAKLPHGPFVRRFGKHAARWHECARGIDRKPFVPRPHHIAIEASMFGEGCIEAEAQVFFALRMLLSRICEDLTRYGKRTGTLVLELEFEDGDRTTIDTPLALPTADERGMFDVLRAKLEGRTFAAPITGLSLQALRLEEAGESTTFFPVDNIDAQNLAVTLARLEAILGEPVKRAVIHPAYPLEQRFSYEPFELS